MTASKTLQITDDKQIRKDAFVRAEKLLRKLDRMEADLKSFHDRDQDLYKKWFHRTFGTYQEHVSRLHEEYAWLRRFHNWVVAASEIFEIPLPEALLIMRREQYRYERGSESERREIDELRRKRDEYIAAQFARQAEEEARFREESFGSSEAGDGQEPEDQEHGHQEHENERTLNGAHFDKAGLANEAAPQKLEHVRSLYRKIVRRIHPDMQATPGNLGQWHTSLWERVQAAYRDKDAPALEQLMRLVHLRFRELNDFTLSEIRRSEEWLHEELERFKQDVKIYKKNPAWGFSRRKDFAALKRKVQRGLERDRSQIVALVEEIKDRHDVLEIFALENERRATGPRRGRRRWEEQLSFFD